MFRRITAFVLLTAVLSFGIVGCDSGDSGSPNRMMQKRIEQLEQQRNRARKGENRWQGYTMFAAVACGFLLVIGAGLGSSARKKARQQRGDSDDAD